MRLENLTKNLNLDSQEIASRIDGLLNDPVVCAVFDEMEHNANESVITCADDNDSERFRNVLRVRLIRELRSKLATLVKQASGRPPTSLI